MHSFTERTFLFQTIQFSMSTLFHCQKKVILQNSCITANSPTDCLLSHQGYALLGGLQRSTGVFYSPIRLGNGQIIGQTEFVLFNLATSLGEGTL